MASNESKSAPVWRLSLVLALMTGAFLFLAGALWRIQIRDAAAYQGDFNRQSARRVRLPARRGRILDRRGRRLADNRPSYGVAIYVEELRQPGRIERTVEHVSEVVDRLAEALGLERELSEQAVRDHVVRQRPLPLLAWRDLDEAALARFVESHVKFPGGKERIPGLDVTVESVRVYPYGALAAHVLGYVGRADPERWRGESDADAESDATYDFYKPAVEGRSGMERAMDRTLQGEGGGYLLQVDALGFKHEELGRREPVAGRDLLLALDADIQAAAEQTLDGHIGAVVALDPRNGDVVALASTPAYDPNAFSVGMSHRDWARLNRDPGRPLVHRAIGGVYAPGSLFKLVVAIAALENPGIGPAQTYDCSGVFTVGNHPFRCWRRQGHGPLAMRKAIEQSCNVYFYELGIAIGHERIVRMADALGIGRRTGIELGGETRGLLPDAAWKRRVMNDAWRAGDTCNLSIGQGALGVTPLQMAVMTAAIANGGRVYRPRLVLSPRPDNPRGQSAEDLAFSSDRVFMKGDLIADLGWAPATLETVQGGMLDVVHAAAGTGSRAKLDGVRMAGKTGTAQYRRDGEDRRFAWMTGYAPFDQPRYVVVIVIEDAPGGGGLVAAPRLKHIMETALGMPLSSERTGRDTGS